MQLIERDVCHAVRNGLATGARGICRSGRPSHETELNGSTWRNTGGAAGNTNVVCPSLHGSQSRRCASWRGRKRRPARGIHHNSSCNRGYGNGMGRDHGTPNYEEPCRQQDDDRSEIINSARSTDLHLILITYTLFRVLVPASQPIADAFEVLNVIPASCPSQCSLDRTLT